MSSEVNVSQGHISSLNIIWQKLNQKIMQETSQKMHKVHKLVEKRYHIY